MGFWEIRYKINHDYGESIGVSWQIAGYESDSDKEAAIAQVQKKIAWDYSDIGAEPVLVSCEYREPSYE